MAASKGGVLLTATLLWYITFISQANPSCALNLLSRVLCDAMQKAREIQYFLISAYLDLQQFFRECFVSVLRHHRHMQYILGLLF